MRWVEIAVGATNASADAVTSIMIEEGCAGTAIGENSGKLKVESPKPGIPAPQVPHNVKPGSISYGAEAKGCMPDSSDCICAEKSVTVLGYLPVGDTLESRLALIRDRVRALPDFGLELSGEIDIKWVRDAEWATAWKAFFHPLKVGKIVIKPSWEALRGRRWRSSGGDRSGDGVRDGKSSDHSALPHGAAGLHLRRTERSRCRNGLGGFGDCGGEARRRAGRRIGYRFSGCRGREGECRASRAWRRGSDRACRWPQGV